MGVLLTLSYDGAGYCGWQRQKNGLSVQEVLERGLTELYGTETRVLGASRTDAGVHALGQRALYKPSGNNIPTGRIPPAVNVRLPGDIIVTGAMDAPEGFHPIKNALRKTYEYRVRNAPYPDPRLREHCWHVKQPLDADAMRRATGYLVGRHDFKAFCAAGCERKSTVRTIYSLNVEGDCGGDIIVRVTGDGFLYNMVRIIAGTLVEIGLGRLPDNLPSCLIATGNREMAGQTAPPGGLTLLNVEY